MYKKDVRIHFVGIGGVGMAGIAEVLANLGYTVSGSDISRSSYVLHLEALGVKVSIGHDANNVPETTSYVVVSTAIDPTNVELLKAQDLGIPVIRRAEMLAELMRMKYGIAVAGSHGKTSTTSMTARVLNDLMFDPTVIIGGRVLSENTGARLGAGEYLLAEADESDGSFNLLRPAIAVVTNVDSEHLSHYKSFGALEQAFVDFMNAIPFYGLVIACGDDPVLHRLLPQVSRRILTYGLNPDLDISAQNLSFKGLTSEYDLYVRGKLIERVSLPMPGKHMVLNSLAATAVAIELGAEAGQVVAPLAKYTGVSRRSEKLGSFNLFGEDEEKVTLIDDYGHHPSEIRATLKALKDGMLKNQSGRLLVVFQPHRYSRTQESFADFLNCFDHADKVFVSDIYAAGESEIPGVTAERLVSSISRSEVRYIGSLDTAPSYVQQEMQAGDVVVTMGAGSVGRFSKDLSLFLKELEKDTPSTAIHTPSLHVQS